MSDRLTLSEIVRSQLLLRRPASDRSAVKLVRNSRGVTQIEIVVTTGEGVETADEAAVKASELFDALAQRYPYPKRKGVGNGGDDDEPHATTGGAED